MDITREIFSYLLGRVGPESSLYLVGGSSRDYLLSRPFSDYDFACALSPEEIKDRLEDCEKANFAFIRFGTADISYKGYRITLASFRKEGEYTDARHPKSIEFIKDPLADSYRRDFTVNAIYLSSDFSVFDPQGGKGDLEKKVIRMIGDIDKRMNEDPLRILRAIRLSSKLGFVIEPELKDWIFSHLDLLHKLKINKIKEEYEKSDPKGREMMRAAFRIENIVIE